jgi:hypothetical protein
MTKRPADPPTAAELRERDLARIGPDLRPVVRSDGIFKDADGFDLDEDAEDFPDPVREARPWRKYNREAGVPYLSNRVRSVIRLAVFGDFDHIGTPMSVESACRICRLQLRAARRLQASELFQNALALAKTERARQEAAQRSPAPSAPLAVISPPTPPLPVQAALEAPDEDIIFVAPMPRLDDVSFRVPAAYVEPIVEPEPASTIRIQGLGGPDYVDMSDFQMRLSPARAASSLSFAQTPRAIQGGGRRSLRRS